MSRGTDELTAHAREARVAAAKIAVRLTGLSIPATHDVWKQHKELLGALDNIDKDVQVVVRENATGPITTLPVNPPVTVPSVTPTPVSTPAPRATVSSITKARGTNWSCYEDGREHIAPTADYLKRVQQIRLPITWDYNKAEIDALLDIVDAVPGAVVWIECHSYGRVGNARNSSGVTTGPLATAQQIADHSVQIFKDFGAHASFRLMLDNEPMQQPGAWEQATQAAVTALAAAGYKGVLVVPLALASNVGAGPSRHPKPWILAPAGIEVVYNGHHYVEGQGEHSGQTVAQLDAYAKTRGFPTFADFIKAWFSWGLLGSEAWSNAPIVIGETHFVIPEHLALYLSLAKSRGVGVFLWADGVWNAGYGYKVNEDDLRVLDSARS